jgi:hypothetical protein
VYTHLASTDRQRVHGWSRLLELLGLSEAALQLLCEADCVRLELHDLDDFAWRSRIRGRVAREHETHDRQKDGQDHHLESLTGQMDHLLVVGSRAGCGHQPARG